MLVDEMYQLYFDEILEYYDNSATNPPKPLQQYCYKRLLISIFGFVWLLCYIIDLISFS